MQARMPLLSGLSRRPTHAFAALAVSAAMLIALSLLVLTRIPGASVTVRPLPGNMVQVDGAGVYAPGDPIALLDARGRVRLATRIDMLVLEKDGSGTAAENRAYHAARDAISRLAQVPGTRLRLPDGRLLPLHARRVTLADVTTGAWLALAIGLCALLAGSWALVLRPGETAPRLFLASGAALAVATITIALSEHMSLAAPAALQFWALRVNMLSAIAFGMSLVALFARYPEPLASWRLLGAVTLACLGLLIASLFDVLVNAVDFTAVIFLLGVAAVVLALVQGWRSRHDPAQRAAFALIGSSLLVCIVGFSATNLIPQMMGRMDVAPVPLATSLFLLFYLALAVAIARYRLFDLGGWAVRVALLALVVLVVLALDIALVFMTGANWTLSTAFLLVAAAWLPLREYLLRRAEGGRSRRDVHLLRGAGDVAFSLHPEQQAARWQALLDQQFAPLNQEPANGAAVAEADIRDDGRVLTVPSPLGGPGLALHYADHGRRLFHSEDKAIADELVMLVREMVAARSAYDRGVQAERQRIARDLHDDVGSRLMTTLHREDIGTVHADVREAMAEMRLIIDGMAGQSRALAHVLADIRHETVNRLGLARIAIDWPLSEAFDDERLLPAAQNRVLVSVVRELVSNAILHAGAAQVRVTCAVADNDLVLSLHDNGHGFDAASDAAVGNGLRNMTRRLEEAGGSFRLESGATGTLAAIRLPLGTGPASHALGMAAAPLPG